MSSTYTKFALAYGYTNQTEVDPNGNNTDTYGPFGYGASYTPGTTASQCDRAYRDAQTLTNASVSYTLSSLPNSQGMGHVRGIVLECLTPIGSGGTGTIGPATSNGWTNGLGGNIPFSPGTIIPPQWPDVGAPAVVGGSNDTITITVTGTLQYRIEIVGTSV